jgi:hypothetical protein
MYVITHPETTDKARVKQREDKLTDYIEKKCPICGKKFFTRYKTAKYDSPKCKERAHTLRTCERSRQRTLARALEAAKSNLDKSMEG